MEKFMFAKLTPFGYEPVKASLRSAGWDVKSAYNYSIPPFGKQLCLTDIQICVPKNTYARVAARSSLALKSHLGIGAGVIDEDFRGNVAVLLFNHGSNHYEVKRGQRIAQLIIETIQPVVLEETPMLPSTERGSGAFGSTGF